MMNGHKWGPAIITAVIVVLGWCATMVWWAASQQASINANHLQIDRVEQSIKERNVPLLAQQVSVLGERVNLLQEEIAKNRELATKLLSQQENLQRTLEDIKGRMKP